MRRRHLLHALRFASVLLILAAPRHVLAAVTVFTNLASFQAMAPAATLVVDFETRNGLQLNPFTDNGLTFSSPNQLYIITPANPGTTSPLPPSRMLSASGAENFFVTMFHTSALGFTLLTNAYSPHVVTLYDDANAVFYTYNPTQAHNTVGFVGFVSTTPIAKMHWVAAYGEVQNTALDNFYVVPAPVPTIPTTWGRVKGLYR
jgi:hypothetical protein